MLTRDPDAGDQRGFLPHAAEKRLGVPEKGSGHQQLPPGFRGGGLLPGLVVDKFSDVLVVESLALGIDRFKVTIVELLKELLAQDGIAIRGVYERSDAKVRLQEGMERYKGLPGGSFDTKVEIVENGVRYFVDVKDGQKTGFFLDQKYNRQAVGRLCRGAWCWTASPIRAPSPSTPVSAGRSTSLGWTPPELGVAQARENAALNGLEDRVEFLCADVFDLLPSWSSRGSNSMW